jgi:hypothetical protein
MEACVHFISGPAFPQIAPRLLMDACAEKAKRGGDLYACDSRSCSLLMAFPAG